MLATDRACPPVDSGKATRRIESPPLLRVLGGIITCAEHCLLDVAADLRGSTFQLGLTPGANRHRSSRRPRGGRGFKGDSRASAHDEDASFFRRVHAGSTPFFSVLLEQDRLKYGRDLSP